MTRLPLSASIATAVGAGKLHAPSATRNLSVITALLRDVAPSQGRALEIASGTGQHINALAKALPQIDWFPTEIAPDRIVSIDAYGAAEPLDNLHPARMLDATKKGWSATQPHFNFIHLGNLLHLITQPAAHTLLREVSLALTPAGTFTLYGPFLRSGVHTSDGDAQFDAELRAADPDIGYKDDAWVTDVLTSAGLTLRIVDMPANNLAFIAKRTAS